MHIDTQFSIFLINKPGVLGAVADALAKAKVNMVALALMDSGEHGALRIVCDSSSKAREVLGKAHDRWTETDVLVMELSNEAGSFAKVAKKLSSEHVNIVYAYCTAGAAGGKTTAVFKVGDLKKAQKVLRPARTPGKSKTPTVKRQAGKGK